MSQDQQVKFNLVSQNSFNLNGMLKAEYGTYAQYLAAQLASKSIYCIDISKLINSSNPNETLANILSGGKDKTNIWNLYNKGKADYEAATGNYENAEKIYKDLKSQQETAKNKYVEYYNLELRNNGGKELSSTQESSLRDKSKYTTDLIKNTNEAEMVSDLLLDKRREAVSEQQRGLISGYIGMA